MKAVYQEEVDIEKIEFSKEDKKRLTAGEVGFGEGCRISGKGKTATFYTHRAINNHDERVEENQYIATFKDGTQRLLTEDEYKDQFTPVKTKEVPVEKTPAVILQTSDGPQVMLSGEKSKELLAEDLAATGEKVPQ